MLCPYDVHFELMVLSCPGSLILLSELEVHSHAIPRYRWYCQRTHCQYLCHHCLCHVQFLMNFVVLKAVLKTWVFVVPMHPDQDIPGK